MGTPIRKRVLGIRRRVRNGTGNCTFKIVVLVNLLALTGNIPILPETNCSHERMKDANAAITLLEK